jgi:hypothetical protein
MSENSPIARNLRAIVLSGGIWLLPTQGVVDHVQPLIPPPVSAPEKGVPGYACGHPRIGYEYSKMEGVGCIHLLLLSLAGKSSGCAWPAVWP